jgi:hypothetical protein
MWHEFVVPLRSPRRGFAQLLRTPGKATRNSRPVGSGTHREAPTQVLGVCFAQLLVGKVNRCRLFIDLATHRPHRSASFGAMIGLLRQISAEPISSLTANPSRTAIYGWMICQWF